MPPKPAGRGRGRGATRGRGRGAQGSPAAAEVGVAGSPTATPTTEAPPPASQPTPSVSDPTSSNSLSSGAPSARGSAAAKPTRGPGGARFRPKNIRRDEASRDLLARQEQDKENARAKEEARKQARSRGRSRRSRGNIMGRGGMNRQSVASGPFSQFAEVASNRGGGWGSAWSGGGGGGGGPSSGFASSARGVKGESRPGFGSASSYREARINADRFAGLPPGHEPDSDDEATAALITADPSAVWPMGIMRIDRKEEKKVLATSAELEAEEQAKDEESLWVDGEVWTIPKDKAVDDNEVWHAAPDGVPIKSEPGEQAIPDSIPDIAPLDFDSHAKQPPAAEAIEIDSKSQTPAEATMKKKPALDPEIDVISRDMKTLLNELGPSGEGGQGRDGRLYLFQFPPVLPPLRPVDTPQVKPEPNDAMNMDQPSAAVGPSAGAGAGAGAGVEGGGKPKGQSPDEQVSIADMAQVLSQGGLMGKLNVRRSGKVELDWGGRTLELAPATDLNFLTKAVVVEQTDEKPKTGVPSGDAFDMGKVMGRFVLAPTWGDEEEWEVASDDLKAE